MKFFWLGLFGFLAAVYTANSLIDVSGLNSYDKIYALSKRQSARQIMVWDNYFDQRPWLKARLDGESTAPDVLILGSSTVGTMSNRGLKGITLVNGWLTSGGIEDLEAVTSILEKSAQRPKAIILGVDPFLFNELDVSENWRSLFDEYLAFHRSHGGEIGRLGPYLQAAAYQWQVFKERLNWSTTFEATRFVWRRWRKNLLWQPVLLEKEPDAYCNEVSQAPWIRAGDGHYHICRNLRGITKETIKTAAEMYVAKNTRFIRDWRRVDSDRLRRLERLVSVWRSWNLEVILVAPPMHPVAYAKVVAVPEIRALLDEMDMSMARLSQASGAKYLNFRDAAVLECSEEEFRDGHHSDQACADRMVLKTVAAAGIAPLVSAGPALMGP